MVNLLSLGVDLDGILDVFGSFVLELLVVSTVTNFDCLVVLAFSCGCLRDLLSTQTFT